ncbi:Holliday junction resolvase RuvX [Paenimyroides tangerinum]|uniref:Holliday junction resolvase RuvX n=1 Tax=Paenimyroides tangerinum TaxID=2488728 RepID=UPI001EEE6E87|nr:Holliday junction resolvase RuvX [Paenimyroides tangerinum]
MNINPSRLLAIDYGGKRTGIAITDEMQIIASGLTTVETKQLFPFLQEYFSKEKVSKVIVGEPKRLNNEPSEIAPKIDEFVVKFKKLYPAIEVIRMDERFTSKMAFQTMIDSGLKKKQRQNKALVDEIAATILLQDFLNSKMF